MSWHKFGKVQLWTGESYNRPDVVPPMALRAIAILCVISVTGVLVYGIVGQLSMLSRPELSILQAIVFIGFHAVIPLGAAYAVSSNRRVSRPLIVIYCLYIGYRAIEQVLELRVTADTRLAMIVAICLLLLTIGFWLYRSPRMRYYYSVVSDRAIPDDLVGQKDVLSRPGPFQKRIVHFASRIAPLLEWAVPILIITLIVFAIAQIG